MGKGRLEDREKFTTGHLAQLLQSSRRTVSRYIEQGKLRARKTVGGWQIVSRQEVLAFLWDAAYDRRIAPAIRVAAAAAYERMNTSPTPRAAAGKRARSL